MNTEELVERIKGKGYWRVIIRPTQFEKGRIKTFSEVRKLIQSICNDISTCAYLVDGI